MLRSGEGRHRVRFVSLAGGKKMFSEAPRDLVEGIGDRSLNISQTPLSSINKLPLRHQLS